MKNFITQFKWSEKLNVNLYYCNKKQKYFYLGHYIPSKCCVLIRKLNSNPIQEILLNQLK